MKKTYESPSVEKIAFQYRDQVVVASGNSSYICEVQHSDAGIIAGDCKSTTNWLSDHA